MQLPLQKPWSQFGLISFRIAFIYLLLYFKPLSFLSDIPLLNSIPQVYIIPFDALVYFFNDHLFHIRNQLVPIGSSGDTSFGWAQIFTYLLLSSIAGLIWSILDRKKTSYYNLQYWICVILRYCLAGIAFIYGIGKVFALQMPFPNLSQLATPLGDYLPMRFSWLFIGYSEPYQIFSGVAEVLVALLLVWRKTALLGALLAIGVFANVVMLNFSYDIPVKIYSANLLLGSVFLAWQEKERLLAFFIQNKAVLPSILFDRQYKGRIEKYTRIALKSVFIILIFGLPIKYHYDYYVQYHVNILSVLEPIQPGMYHVELFVKNGDTIPESLVDSLRWRDVIFDYNGSGSISANDSSLRMRYGRAYFNYQPDSLEANLKWKFPGDTTALADFELEIPETGRMILRGQKSEDYLYVVLKKLNRHFPLTERQFHWISESNR